MERALRRGHYGEGTRKRALWRGHYGEGTMERALRRGHYGEGTKKRALWRVRALWNSIAPYFTNQMAQIYTAMF